VGFLLIFLPPTKTISPMILSMIIANVLELRHVAHCDAKAAQFDAFVLS